MDKIYLLTITKGNLEKEIKLGFFNSLELAEKEKENVVRNLLILSNKYTKEEIMEFETALLLSYEEAFYLDIDEEIEYSEELINYMNWPFREKDNRFNIKDIKIVEYSINQILIDITEI